MAILVIYDSLLDPMLITKGVSVSALLFHLVGQENRLTVHRAFIQLTGSHTKAFVLDQLFFWQSKVKRASGWFYKTHQELADECLMSVDQIRRATSSLKKLGFIQTIRKKANGFPTTHYKVNIRAIEDAFDALHQINTGCGEIAETENSDMAKSPNGNGEIAETMEVAKSPKPITYTNIPDHTDNRSVHNEIEQRSKNPKKRQTKPAAFKALFAAYPKHRKGGTDTTAWSKWKSERLTEQDAQEALNWLKLAAQTNPDWETDAGGCYVYGITKFIRERMWLTPIPQPNTQAVASDFCDNDTSWRHDLGL